MVCSGFPARRRAYTLVEILIVLAILVALAALSWPAVQRTSARSALRAAARQVRAALVQTRLDAMESAASRQFVYRLDSRYYEIVTPGDPAAASAAEAELWSAELSAAEPSADGTSPGVEPQSTGANQDELPEGITFAARTEANPMAETGTTDAPLPDAPILPTSLSLASTEGSAAPILFYPNGRATDARLRLVGRLGYSIEVQLRGATGSVRIGELQIQRDPTEEPSP